MIQDIGPKKLVNHYDPGKRPSEGAVMLHFRDGRALTSGTEDRLVLPRYGEVGGTDVRYLFSIDEEDFFLIMDDAVDAPDGYSYTELRQWRTKNAGPRDLIFGLYTAQHLWRWYHDSVFCGTCGTRTEHSKTERAMVCPSCGRIIYPRIQPAVIVGVTNGDSLLCTKYNRPGASFYALVAGFTEIGETAEETVMREVMEEAGLRVKNIRYYKSQPWGIADDLLMGFYCDVDGDDTIRMDRTELKEALWVPRKEIVGQTTDFSLTNEMMVRFREGLEPR